MAVANKQKQRESNIELLRIISMLLVMVLHVDFFALGYPTVEEISLTPANAFTRILFQMVSIGSVNTFVLISGWFGIRLSMKSLSSFIFQCVFFTWGIFVVIYALGLTHFSLGNFEIDLFFKSWFVQNYIILMLLAPAINSMFEFQVRKVCLYSLIGLFLIEFIYDYISFGGRLFGAGYSALHFIFLYMLARYVRKYGIAEWVKKFSAMIFLLLVASMSVVIFLGSTKGIEAVMRLNCYTNPLVICASMCLILTFSKLKFCSSAVNWIAKSTFAVYLIHTNMYLQQPYYVKWANAIYADYSGIVYLLFMACYLAGWFAVAVLIDKIRIIIWERAYNRFVNNER